LQLLNLQWLQKRAKAADDLNQDIDSLGTRIALIEETA
jgi:hypothetical protein